MAFNPPFPKFHEYEVVSYLGGGAMGRDHTHRRYIYHRDIKPGNILLDEGGHARITDFGIAACQGMTRMTQTGAILGTFHYMSPEQCNADRSLDGRTDIYSLGIMLF